MKLIAILPSGEYSYTKIEDFDSICSKLGVLRSFNFEEEQTVLEMTFPSELLSRAKYTIYSVFGEGFEFEVIGDEE